MAFSIHLWNFFSILYKLLFLQFNMVFANSLMVFLARGCPRTAQHVWDELLLLRYRITFDFVPKFVWIHSQKYSSDSSPQNFILGNSGRYGQNVINTSALSTFYVAGTGFGSGSNDFKAYGKKSADGKTLFWYNPQYASWQYNDSGYSYFYIALG